VVSTVFDFMFFAVFVQQGATTLQTIWFMGSILTELVFLFSTRTKLPFYKASQTIQHLLVEIRQFSINIAGELNFAIILYYHF